MDSLTTAGGAFPSGPDSAFLEIARYAIDHSGGEE
jgi:hypothetical protein